MSDPPSSNNGTNQASSGHRLDQDAFLSSFTFASGDFGRQCDCDDCGAIPEAVMAKIREHKRKRIIDIPLKRTQARELVLRDDGVAIWTLTMPRNAEPLVEFGNSHRFLWIKRLPHGSILKSIGTGIVGSADEEKSRAVLDWKEGNVYFIPSNGGKACGWVHSTKPTASEGVDASESSNQEPSGHAIVYIVKVPAAKLGAKMETDTETMTEDQTQNTNFRNNVLELCRRGLEDKGEPSTQLLGPDDSNILIDAVKNAEENKGKPSSNNRAPKPTSILGMGLSSRGSS